MSRQPDGLSPYPFDLSPLLALTRQALDGQSISSDALEYQRPHFYQPTILAQEALIKWNTYLDTGDEQQRTAFLAQAAWFVQHATSFVGDVSGWPVLTHVSTLPEPVPLLSASVQGLALSVVIRAYQLTHEEAFGLLARRAAHAFELDIFDGGVSAPVGGEGIFFEEVAAYPATRRLSSCLIALYGLYDYLTIADDAHISDLIQGCLATLSTLVPAFDTGYWSRVDLSTGRLAAPVIHALHIEFLKALTQASGDPRWAVLAARWAGYRHSLSSRLRYFLSNLASSLPLPRLKRLAHRNLPDVAGDGQRRKSKVCVAITAFPVAGGMRSVLAGVAKAMVGEWEMEYLTWHIGSHSEGMTIRSFGNSRTTSWQFPNVWFYVFAGGRKLLSLLRHSQGYHVILPQDGVFTGVYATLAAKLAGVRVVCMDHGHIPQLYNQTYRVERLKVIAADPWMTRFLVRLRYACYWPSLRLLTRIATHAADSFLLAGDDVETTYRQRLGVSSDRIIRYPYLIDTERYAPLDALEKVQKRMHLQLPPDGIIVAMVNRLAPEKGIDIALEGISRALRELPVELGSKVRVVVAGDGPLRSQVEEDVRRYQLESTCALWGEVTPDAVALLLRVSDLFLFTATRDSNSVAVLEAMAAGLMVIASTVPPSKAALLAEGRGLAIPVGDAEAVGVSLAESIRDLPRCREMGKLAGAYIQTHYSAEVVRRCLLRATGWPLAASDVNQMLSEHDLIVAEQGMS